MHKMAEKSALCLALAIPLLGNTALAGSNPGQLAGIWKTSRDLGEGLAGLVVVDGTHAELEGVRAAAEADAMGRLYCFPGRRGELRVVAPAPATMPIAFWVQPMTISGSSYATPVYLRKGQKDLWRGQIAPVANRVTMTLYVQRSTAGAVTAFLRDPLYNLGRPLQTMTVTSDGSTLSLRGPAGKLSGSILNPDTISIAIPRDGLPSLTLTRSAEPAAQVSENYREPLPAYDGWTTARASSVGFAIAPLEDLERFAAGSRPTAVTSPAVHAVLVARHGKLVVDDYFAPFDAGSLHDTRSAGKTYADVLAGAAIEAGVPLSGNTPLLPLFARYGTLANPDPRKAKITLGNALSMATGLDCDDNDEHSAANENTVQNQTSEPDWYRLLLNVRMVRDPGTKAVYCSASINLAGGAIASATHAWLPAYFAQHVAAPLQMKRYALNLTPTGDWYLGGGAYVRPRDFLKIGQLFLNGGTWNGRRVIPRTWIEQSWNAHLAFDPGDGYGYAWHVRSYTVDGKTYRAYEAQGNGGQILDVLPRLDLTVMIAAGNYNNYKTWGPTRDAIVTRIIKAIPGE